jgi:hypothetical protein
VTWTSDFIGPLPTNSTIVLSFNADNDFTMAAYSVSYVTPQPSGAVVVGQNTQATFLATNQGQIAEGATAYVRAELRSGTDGSTLDTGTAQLPWHATSDTGVLINQVTAGSGGMTTEEHGWLSDIQTWIQNTASFGGRLGLQALAGGILDHPDVGLMSLCGSAGPLSGRGQLQRTATGIGVNAFGLALAVSSRPPGVGLIDGQIQEYEIRVAQLCTTHQSQGGSVEYVTEILDMNADNQAWVWRNAYPERILYDVTPGFVLDAEWLCVTIG